MRATRPRRRSAARRATASSPAERWVERQDSPRTSAPLAVTVALASRHSMMLPAGDRGYVCVVPNWLQDLLAAGDLCAVIGMRGPPASAICPAPGPHAAA